jgi:hypothetical protein
VKRGALPHWSAKQGFTELQVIQLCLVRVLQEVLGPHDGKIAWDKIGDELLRSVLQPRFDLVVETDRPRCTLARNDRELADAVRHSRCLWVIPLADEVTEVREAFDDHWRALHTSKGPAETRRGSTSESA